MVAGFTLEWWPDADRNPGRMNVGICSFHVSGFAGTTVNLREGAVCFRQDSIYR